MFRAPAEEAHAPGQPQQQDGRDGDEEDDAVGLKPQRLRPVAVNGVQRDVDRIGRQDGAEHEAEQALFHAKSLLNWRTASSGPSLCSHTPAETARKSAPAS